MKKVITVENQSIEVNSSMGWLFVYREQFGHDILPDILPLLDAALEALAEIYAMADDDSILGKIDEGVIEKIMIPLSGLEVTTIINCFWAMAKNADASIPEPKTWANQFEVLPIDVLAVELFTLVLASSVSSKNSQSLLDKIKEIRLTSMN